MFQLIAIEAVDKGGYYGIAVLTDYGEITDSSWKCIPDEETNWFSPDFDDSHWPYAIEVRVTLPLYKQIVF